MIRKCVFCGERFGTADGWKFHNGQRGCKTKNSFYRHGMWQTYGIWWTSHQEENWLDVTYDDPNFDPYGKWGWSEKSQKIV